MTDLHGIMPGAVDFPGHVVEGWAACGPGDVRMEVSSRLQCLSRDSSTIVPKNFSVAKISHDQYK